MLAYAVLALAACAVEPAATERNVCPGARPIPAAVVFECDASTPDAGACVGTITLGTSQVWGDGGRYAVGCRAYLPVREPACIGVCCGPHICYCTATPDGPSFVCPQ